MISVFGKFILIVFMLMMICFLLGVGFLMFFRIRVLVLLGVFESRVFIWDFFIVCVDGILVDMVIGVVKV